MFEKAAKVNQTEQGVSTVRSLVWGPRKGVGGGGGELVGL